VKRAAALDQALLAAHDSGDFPELVRLYRLAGETALRGGDADAGCFYLTHAYVYALDCGDDAADELKALLVAHGREE